MPADRLGEEARHQLTQERAQVDAHVKDREARVAPRAAFGIKVADDRGDVRFQKPRAADDEHEPEEERQLPARERRQAYRDVSRGDADRAVEYRAPESQQSVSDPA